jgi:peptide/nickel transport system ATP-binding protein
MTGPLLAIEALQVTYGPDHQAVGGVDLVVHAGQTVAVVGESGSGKSTLAAAVLGLLPAGGRITAGRILFDDEDLVVSGSRRMQEIRGSGIGYVPQDPMTNLNPVWRVGFQVREALRANHMTDRQGAQARSVELLSEVGMRDCQSVARRYPHQLSGGMCQRALIAIGLAAKPRLLIADEPTSALDVTVARQVLDHLQAMAAELGTAVLLITHDLALAAERASGIVVMSAGQVVESGAARDIIDAPRREYTRRLVASAPSLAAARVRAPAHPRPADDLLVATGLAKAYRVTANVPWRHREINAVDGASFRVRRGGTVALAGESGSGKSTVARMVLGLLKPTAGSVTFDGVDVAAMNRRERFEFARRVQPVFQNPYSSLDPMYSVYRLIEEPLRIHGVADSNRRGRIVREALDDVALPQNVLARRPRELSGGQRQRVAIARALVLRPDLVVCDEAVSALDVIVQAQILKLLADLQARLGLAYLFISHDLAVIRQVADEVVVMRAGRIVEAGCTEDVFTEPRDEYTRRLLEAIPGRVARRDR